MKFHLRNISLRIIKFTIPAVTASALVVGLIAHVSAATTISTDIVTGGNITAGGSVGIGTSSPFTTLGVAAPTTEYLNDGFEDNSILPFTTTGDAGWAIQGSEVHVGSLAAKAGTLSDNQTSVLNLSATLTGPATVSFYYKVSSEQGFDLLTFVVNNEIKQFISGEIGWTKYSLYLPAGSYTFKWAYTKDAGTGAGSDTAWLDDIDIHYDSTTSLFKGQAGVGSLLPGVAFNVDGDINTSGSYKINNLPVMNLSSSNAFVGTNLPTTGFTGTGNTTFGASNASGLTTGSFNSLFGVQAGGSLVSGESNVAMGTQSLFSSIVGTNNTSIGYGALYGSTNSFNTAVGSFALVLNETGIANVAMGYGAGYYETESYRFYVSNQPYNDLSQGRSHSMMYGVFADQAPNQDLRINAHLTVTGTTTLISNVGIGIDAGTSQLQVTTSSSNATSTMTVGKTGQNKGTCLELFDAAGTVRYAYLVPGATTLTISATSCK